MRRGCLLFALVAFLFGCGGGGGGGTVFNPTPTPPPAAPLMLAAGLTSVAPTTGDDWTDDGDLGRLGWKEFVPSYVGQLRAGNGTR